ncbi:NACHT domain-containing protein [Actinomadura sp. KC06]|uniref:NACHT domain-containing protein n=1 Tax=Actinomadura sp. KC06 TaxID=2530369 RepID=UPI0010451583|nr:NACHT domain-containing protein [Actinomadura sp. KC06]TDD28988.1 NACHT domain-containing protein [Actinomadura sp. KC06]
MGRALIAASLSVAAGVAVNQILNNGKLSWSWGYLALMFTVLGALAQAASQAVPQPVPPPAENPAPGRRPWRARHAYLRRMRSSVDQMETIGLVTQAEFVLRTRQVYVDVKLQPKPVTDTVTDSGIGSGPPGRDTGPPAAGRRDSLASFLTAGRVLAVLGAAGSGKTTLARYTALELAEQRWWRRGPLPVLLYLRDHVEAIQSGQPENLARIAADAPWLGNTVPAEWLERRLARGQCVVLLDGLDEVADTAQRSRVVRWVEEQISRYPGNAFVVTSRPLGYDANRLTRADVLQVQRFTSGQIRAFLHAWYRAIEHRSRDGAAEEIDRIAAQAADDLFHRIGDRPSLYDLAANPLLLTMIANVHRYRGSLPGSRAALYEEVCQVLLHRRQEAKNLPDHELESLSGERKERIVQELAWHMMRNHLRDIPIEQAARAIRPVLQRTAPDVTPEAFLTRVRRSGLLLEHQHGRYGFAHLTLQEYLAAALVPGHASRRQVLMDNVSDAWWRETTLLWAARADASPVVEACLAARTVTALHLAYACASEARELDPPLRAELDRLLTVTPSDPDEIRLLDGVAAARALQDTYTIDDNGTLICARPVPDDLWHRYARDTDVPAITGNPLSADIEKFLLWLNYLFSDGANHRLPTPTEARQALDSGRYSGAAPILYADGDDQFRGPQFILGESARHPFEPTQGQIAGYPTLILDHLQLVLRLLVPRSDVPFSHLLAYAAPRDSGNLFHQLLYFIDVAYELTCALSQYRCLVRERALGHSHVFNWNPAHSVESARELATDLHRARGFPDPSIESALSAVVDLVREVDSAGLPADVPVLNQALSQAIAVVLDQATTVHLPPWASRSLRLLLDRTSELVLAFTRDISGTQDTDHDPDHIDALGELLRDLLAQDADAHGLHLQFAFDLARKDDFGFLLRSFSAADIARGALTDALYRESRVCPTARGYATALRHTRIESAAQASAVDAARAMSRGADLACDLAFARAAAWSVGTDVVMGLGMACNQLARHFAEPSAENRVTPVYRRGEVIASFGRFQDHLNTAAFSSPADDPIRALTLAGELSQSSSRGSDVLISSALEFVRPLSVRSRPIRQSDLVSAVTCLLAVLTLEETTSHPETSQLLRSTVSALIALTPDTGGRSERAQLVLVRN